MYSKDPDPLPVCLVNPMKFLILLERYLFNRVKRFLSFNEGWSKYIYLQTVHSVIDDIITVKT